MTDNAPRKNIHTKILGIWDLLPTEEALKRFQEMLQEFQNVSPEPTRLEMDVKMCLDQIDRGQILTQLARTQGLMGKFDGAHKTLDEAEKIAKDAKNIPVASSPFEQELAILNARIELERGRVVNSSGNSASSIRYFKNALNYASSSTEHISTEASVDKSAREYISILLYLTVDSLHMLAFVQDTKEDREESARRGLEIAEREANDPLVRRWVGPLLNNSAWDTVESGDFEKAVSVFQRAVEARKEVLDDLEHEGWYSILTAADKATAKEKRVTTWKIARWSVGHAQMMAGKEGDAFETLTGILSDGLDGPAIRADLAILVAKKSDSSAAGHAKRAIALGVSKEKFAEMNAIIAQLNE